MIRIIIGRREQGKTTLARRMALNVESRLIFDPRGLMPEHVSDRREFMQAYTDLVDGEREELAFCPAGDVNEGFELYAWYLAHWVRTRRRRPLGALVDEAAFVSTDVQSFQWVLRCCARDSTQIYLTAHRPADIQTNVRAIADYWYLFACRQEHDLKVIGERCGEPVVLAVSELRAHHFVYWNDTTGGHLVHQNPRSWFVALDSNPRPAPVLVAA